MKGFKHRICPRSIGAQIDRMRGAWPDFRVVQRAKAGAVWEGPLKGFARSYIVRLTWIVGETDRPRVQLVYPPLEPLEGGKYEDIPHLMFIDNDPQASGLCLFDPDGREWAANMLIADTTVPWAARWLYFYELWHIDGKWRGGGVGAESVGAMRDQALHDEAAKHKTDAEGAAAVAEQSPV